jgi:hypothetical protein
MIKDLDNSLKKLLEVELLGVLSNVVQVLFDPPDESFRPPPGTVNFFLYDIRENLELRSNEWQIERQSNGVVNRKLPLVRVDCSYLVTAWSGDVESEHSLLGEVMKVLLRYPTLPEGVLQGSLSGQEPPLPTCSLQPARLQSLGEFWQALGGKPKATLHYTVTISVDPYKSVEEPLVTDVQSRLRAGLDQG